MKGYPKHIATKQDFENLLAMSEYREQALADLKKILETDDDFVTVATERIDPNDIFSEWKTKEIPNPLPLYKQKGFGSREEVQALIEQYS